MPPTSDGKEKTRTVGCALKKLIPDAGHLEKIRHAVTVTRKASILASELLNIHLRRLLVTDLDADHEDRMTDEDLAFHRANICLECD